MNLRVTASTWASASAVLNRSFTHPRSPEWGAIGLLGVSRDAFRPALLVSEILTPCTADFKDQGPFGLSFDRSYLRRAMLHARERNIRGLITFHTHPGSDEHVDFSDFDDREDPIGHEAVRLFVDPVRGFGVGCVEPGIVSRVA